MVSKGWSAVRDTLEVARRLSSLHRDPPQTEHRQPHTDVRAVASQLGELCRTGHHRSCLAVLARVEPGDVEVSEID